jgi:hypothetical protein
VEADLLLSVMEKRVCGICLGEVRFQHGITCPKGLHFFCSEDFENLVKSQCAEKSMAILSSRDGDVKCCECDVSTSPAFPLQPKHVNVVLKAKERLCRFKVAQEAEDALRREKSQGPLAISRTHVEEEILTNKCPKCRQAFADFSGCCSVTCAGCGIKFCAFCLGGATKNAAESHGHVSGCVENPGQGYFCNTKLYEEQQARRKGRLVKEYLDTVQDVFVREELRRVFVKELAPHQQQHLPPQPPQRLPGPPPQQAPPQEENEGCVLM